jgi:hypothetical protein
VRCLIQDHELFNFVLGLAVLVFLWSQRRELRRLSRWPILLISYAALLAAWTTTLLEGLVWPDALNILVHAFYAISATAFSVWCWRALRVAGRDR